MRPGGSTVETSCPKGRLVYDKIKDPDAYVRKVKKDRNESYSEDYNSTKRYDKEDIRKKETNSLHFYFK